MPRTGMVRNTSVRARQFIADALRGFPFKGVGVSREKVRFIYDGIVIYGGVFGLDKGVLIFRNKFAENY